MIESPSPRNELYDHITLHHILIWTYMEKYLSGTRSFFKTCIPNFEPSNFILSNFEALRFRLDTATDSWLAPSGLHIKSNPQWKSECGILWERERERSQFISLISQFIPLVNISYINGRHWHMQLRAVVELLSAAMDITCSPYTEPIFLIFSPKCQKCTQLQWNQIQLASFNPRFFSQNWKICFCSCLALQITIISFLPLSTPVLCKRKKQ